MDSLKQFVLNPTRPEVKVRVELLQDINHLISSKSDMPDAALRTCLLVMTKTLGLYHDKKSRSGCATLVRTILWKQEALCDFVMQCLENVANFQLHNKSPSRSESARALCALSWSCIVAESLETSEAKSKAWDKLVAIQSALYLGSQASSHPPIYSSAQRKLIGLWRKLPAVVQIYSKTLLGGEPSVSKCCLLGLLVSSSSDVMSGSKQDAISVFVKAVVMSKTTPPLAALRCCEPLIRMIDHKVFAETILPAMQKALLRNSENVMPTVRHVVASVPIDLSRHALSVSKILVSQLTSKNDAARDVAVQAFVAMATQCSDVESVSDLVKYLFAVLKGSEGKLTLVGQKQSVLEAIGGFAVSGIGSGESPTSLASATTTMYLSFLQQELHEGTLLVAARSMASWCAKLRNHVPEELVHWFGKAPAMKPSTPAVRAGYIECMTHAFRSDTLSMAEPLIPYLLQTIDKASKQTSQTALVTEALYASLLLVKMENVEFKKSHKFVDFWNVVLDAKKSLFTSEKYLQHAPEDALLKLQTLIGQLLLEHPQKISGDMTRQFYRCLIHSLLHKSWKVRKATTKTVKHLLASFSGMTFCSSILPELFDVMRPSQVIDVSAIDDDAEAKRLREAPKHFISALRSLTSAPSLKADRLAAKDVANQIMVDSHHPVIASINDHFWTDFLFFCNFDVHQFVEDNFEEISTKLIKPPHHSQSSLAALSTVVRIAPDVICPYLVKHSLDVLDMSQLSQVTKDEVEIMRTPSGSLYNWKIVDSAPKIVENKNVKRENKLYSFKEQLAAEELKREQDRKRKGAGTGGVMGKGGRGAPPIPQNLNKKQKELVESELEREENIRNKLLKVEEKFQSLFEVLQETLCTAPAVESAYSHLVPLITPLLRLLPSPLVSSRVQELYVALGKTMMEATDPNLGLQIAYVTLRLSKPFDDVEQAWCEESLNSAVLRLLSKVCSRKEPIPSPSFSFIFPFLQLILRSGGKVVDSDTKIMCAALNVAMVHAKVRALCEGGVHTPLLLPRVHMLECMGQLVATSLVQVQHLASVVMLEVCKAASGDPGCAHATTEEINVLLKNLLSPTSALRFVSLKGLQSLANILSEVEDPDTEKNIIRRAWVAMHDVKEENAKLAVELWETLSFDLTPNIVDDLLDDVQYHVPVIQQIAADALRHALTEHPQSLSPTLQKLFDIYNVKLERPPPVMDQLGRVIAESPPDQFQPRIGVALALKSISPLLHSEHVRPLFAFLVPDAVGDRHAEVRNKMLDSALRAVNDHGKESTSDLLEIFETFLKEAPTSESYDSVRQNIVILLGTLARHLDKTDPKVKPIVKKLTETLSTPSQAVQEAVANCLPPLVPSIKDDAPDIVKKLLLILLESENYGERKGAAYGLAGMVKGLGIISFKQHDIISKLTDAIQDKKNYRHREGALLAFEMFCGMLGRLFEPYIVHLLPHLLLCFGDGNQYVREAADNTARAVMRNLSAHGVRLVLPSLLNALNEDLWRTKTGSAELLGAMAHCAPKQLSSCLPNIVPKLCEVLTDSHPKVQKAGQQALKQIGSVIRNPEIQAISNTLLAALSDPSHKTTSCLETLLNTKFVHFIDAPSLALILPVVERAFQDRSMDTRKMAAQIIGNMYSLTDQKDLNPYLPAVIPGLKNTLLDPVPEVRAIAAKALGAMVKETGESQFRELLPWMMEKLTSEQSAVDRSGAAQGLSEILAALGPDQLAKLMPEVVKTAQSDTILPHVREGYIMLFVYLPTTFNDDFIPYISDVIPPILKALADENEFVRATALLGGQRIITMFSETAMPVLLPQLERGLFDNNWRIRLSSIQLLGDLLYQITGVTGKMSATGDEDDNFGTAEGFKALVEKLGQERRDLVLSGLYMGRSDVAIRVRQSSLHVWKIIVPNTPRVLREILPTLFKLLLGCLASPNHDKRQVAAKTLGDIVRKLGERMLPELIPILECGLDSDEPSQREGVCVGLTEIIRSCSKDAIVVFTDNLVPTVRKALCDPLDGVRQAAATTFEHLHNTIGVHALDEIVPALLARLKDDATSAYVVDGLRQIITVKGRVVLPFIVPKLVEPPINTEVLAFLSSVAGGALTKHLPTILKALLSALVEASGDEASFEAVLGDCKVVLDSIEGEHGMRIIVDDLLLRIKSNDAGTRHASVVLLCAFCQNKDTDYSDYVAVFIQSFVKLLSDPEEKIQIVAWNALSAVTATLDQADLQRHVSSVRHALRFVKSDETVQRTGTLPGFCLPKKGMTPLLPLFREGILNGSPDLKEQSARGLAECIDLLTPAALKPSVVQITGPLIRILGDRFSSNVRVAFLETLSLLLVKTGAFLKPFLPQLQTTFSKALLDPNRAVRLQAGHALAHLCSIHTRIDPLFTDLNNNINNIDESSVRETLLQALRGCINRGGQKMGPKIKSELISTLSSQLSTDDDTTSRCAAGCLGNLCKFMDDAEISRLMTHHILVKDPSASWTLRQSRSALLAVALKEACPNLLNDQWESRVMEQVLAFSSVDRVQIVTHGIHCASYLMLHFSRSGADVPHHVINSFKHGVENASNDVKTETCRSITWVVQELGNPHEGSGEKEFHLPEKALLSLVSLLLPLAREKNTTVKSAAEFTLVSLLKLRHTEEVVQNVSGKLTSRDSTSLMEIHKQRLKKVAANPETLEDIDNTVLKS